MTNPANNTNEALGGLFRRNPAWVQLLGLCPLLAVSNSLVNALGLAAASTLVIVGSNTSVALLRPLIASHVRLPLFMLLIASFTTCAVLLLEAFAFSLYTKIALFVQIIVTNCMILGRIEAFASKQGVLISALDALTTALGFALALVLLGSVREILGNGTLGANLEQLFGAWVQPYWLQVLPEGQGLSIASLPPGAFIIAGLMLGLGNWFFTRRLTRRQKDSPQIETTQVH